jgi:hypothetical protein
MRSGNVSIAINFVHKVMYKTLCCRCQDPWDHLTSGGWTPATLHHFAQHVTIKQPTSSQRNCRQETDTNVYSQILQFSACYFYKFG